MDYFKPLRDLSVKRAKPLNKLFGDDFNIFAKITSYNLKFVSEAKTMSMEVLHYKK